jgi:NAD(P)-dependent dehydrogenase (short-subunit alcohol dehydrogenase family)
MKLEGKSVLITGASRGLGAALGERLLERGARVVLVSRGEKGRAGEGELRRTAERLSKKGEVHALSFDISNKAETHQLAGAAAALVGPIDVLIHNASTLGKVPLELLLDTECEDFAHVLETNLIGPFRLSKVIAGSMALRGSGTIVHLSSDAAVNAYERWGAYGVSKAAFDHLARSFAVELAPHGVRVFSVDPGEMNTKMHADALPDADPRSLADPSDVALRIATLLERDDIVSGARLLAGGS